MPAQTTQHHFEGVAVSTQPVVYGVAGATILGITVNDWVLIGTGLLLILNLSITVGKLILVWKEKHNGD